MTKRVIYLATVALVLTAAVAAAALPRGTTLPQLFPELAGAPETNGVAIGIGWMGLSPLSPLTAGYLLELHGDQFEGQGIFHVAKMPLVKRAVAIPHDRMRAFLTAANKVSVVEGPYQAHIEHTDDYPSLDIEISVDRNVLRIGSQSQHRPKSDYVDRTPWHIDYRGRTFVVSAADLDQAFEPLEPYLQDDKVFNDMWEDYNRKR